MTSHRKVACQVSKRVPFDSKSAVISLHQLRHVKPHPVTMPRGDSNNIIVYLFTVGTAVAQWLRCCATNRKVAGSIPAGVSGFFIDIKCFRSHYVPGVDSASNTNECQEYFLGVKATGA